MKYFRCEQNILFINIYVYTQSTLILFLNKILKYVIYPLHEYFKKQLNIDDNYNELKYYNYGNITCIDKKF